VAASDPRPGKRRAPAACFVTLVDGRLLVRLVPEAGHALPFGALGRLLALKVFCGLRRAELHGGLARRLSELALQAVAYLVRARGDLEAGVARGVGVRLDGRAGR
jgi:hypothetical protein